MPVVRPISSPAAIDTGPTETYRELASERGITFPPALLASLRNLPSLLEGVAKGDGFHVTFGLGHQEPVTRLYVTPRGDAADLERGLAALKADAGAVFRVSGDD